MNDEELIKQFIRIKRDCAEGRLRLPGIYIEFDDFHWPTPSTPVSRWTLVSELPLKVSQEQIDIAIRSVLDDSRYFRVCRTCHERNPNGWMHDDRVCQGCSGAKY